MSKPATNQLPPITDRSYGIIAVRRNPSLSRSTMITLTTSTTQILLILQKTISRPYPTFWSFPKGHAELYDASTLHSAIREIFEETCLTIIPSDIITFMDKTGEEVQFRERYINPASRKGRKEVRFWVAEVRGKDAEKELRVQEKEVEEARWCTFKEASELLTHQETKEIAELVGNCLDGLDGRERVVEEKEKAEEKL